MNSFNDSEIVNIKSFSHYDKKKIVSRITDLKNKHCNTKIFKIIYEFNINYSKNDNGVFFNLNELNNETLSKIENIIDFYENKNINKISTPNYSKIDYNYSDSSDFKNKNFNNNISISRQKNIICNQ